MPTLIATHQLKHFDDWARNYADNPPPPQGTWRVLRGVDDPNRVYVVGEVDEADLDAVNAWAGSDAMQAVFARVTEISDAPLEIVWTREHSGS